MVSVEKDVGRTVPSVPKNDNKINLLLRCVSIYFLCLVCVKLVDPSRLLLKLKSQESLGRYYTSPPECDRVGKVFFLSDLPLAAVGVSHSLLQTTCL